jgi:hypothetical protein
VRKNENNEISKENFELSFLKLIKVRKNENNEISKENFELSFLKP